MQCHYVLTIRILLYAREFLLLLSLRINNAMSISHYALFYEHILIEGNLKEVSTSLLKKIYKC